VVLVRGPKGGRRIAIDEFHRLPGDHPERDTNLGPGELILGVDLPRSVFVHNYHYLKVRERASFAFALVSAAVGMQITAGAIVDARIALGGVAHKPWLAKEAGALLVGKSVSNVDLDAVAAAAVQGAQPLAQNAYKIQLAKNAVVRAVKQAMEAA
jgi:xanthine dehydrogenase YagS FAD-binding subunit